MLYIMYIQLTNYETKVRKCVTGNKRKIKVERKVPIVPRVGSMDYWYIV